MFEPRISRIGKILVKFSPKFVDLYVRIYGTVKNTLWPRSGVGNSFGFEDHIRDKIGIRGPVHAHVN
jgi:hypothetical protein